MSEEKWVTVRTQWCELAKDQVEIKEKRIYPADVIPDPGAYQVVAVKCNYDIACNAAGHPCSLAYNNPGMDRYKVDDE